MTRQRGATIGAVAAVLGIVPAAALIGYGLHNAFGTNPRGPSLASDVVEMAGFLVLVLWIPAAALGASLGASPARHLGVVGLGIAAYALAGAAVFLSFLLLR